jgi:hypothetical protein
MNAQDITPFPHLARSWADHDEALAAASLWTLDCPTTDLDAVAEFDGCGENAPSRIGVWFVRTVQRPHRMERIVRDRIGWLR